MIKKIVLTFLIAVAFVSTYGQSINKLLVRDEIRLGDSSVTSWYQGVLVDKAYVDAKASDINYGTFGQVPFMNNAEDGFSYSDNFIYSDGYYRTSIIDGNDFYHFTTDPANPLPLKMEAYYFTSMFPDYGALLGVSTDSLQMRTYSGSNNSKITMKPTRVDFSGDFYLNGKPLASDTTAWTLNGNTLHPDDLGYNVGIGTNSSGSKLGVNGTCFANTFLGDLWESNGTNNYINFDFSGSAGDIPIYDAIFIGNSTFPSLTRNPFISVNPADDNLVLFANSTSSTGKWSALVGEGDVFSLKTNYDAFQGFVYDNVNDASLIDSSLVPKRYVDAESISIQNLDNSITFGAADTWYNVMPDFYNMQKSDGFTYYTNVAGNGIVVGFDGYVSFSAHASMSYAGTAAAVESVYLRVKKNGTEISKFNTAVTRNFRQDGFTDLVSFVDVIPVTANDTITIEARVTNTDIRIEGANSGVFDTPRDFNIFLKEEKLKERTSTSVEPPA